MKLTRLYADGDEVIGRLAGDEIELLGEGGQDRLISIAMGEAVSSEGRLPTEQARLLGPIDRPPSIRDFLTFEEHVRNCQGGRAPNSGWYDQPPFYFGNPAATIGPDEPVMPPVGCRALDYELEAACVIGRTASDLDPLDPATLDVIAGFTILNDWSARDLQAIEMPQNLGPAKGKDFASSLGPWLVTPDELPAVGNGRYRAAMTAHVNGTQTSSGRLEDMHFSWPEILAVASANTQLIPGDVIGSGTCGTGCLLEWRLTGHRDTHPWLQAGDVVELEIEGIGVLRNTIVARSKD